MPPGVLPSKPRRPSPSRGRRPPDLAHDERADFTEEFASALSWSLRHCRVRDENSPPSQPTSEARERLDLVDVALRTRPSRPCPRRCGPVPPGTDHGSSSRWRDGRWPQRAPCRPVRGPSGYGGAHAHPPVAGDGSEGRARISRGNLPAPHPCRDPRARHHRRPRRRAPAPRLTTEPAAPRSVAGSGARPTPPRTALGHARPWSEARSLGPWRRPCPAAGRTTVMRRATSRGGPLPAARRPRHPRPRTVPRPSSSPYGPRHSAGAVSSG